MQITFLRRVPLAALACIVALAAVAPVAADSRVKKLQKIEPRRTVEYRPGRTFTPDTDVLSASGYAAWMIDEVLAATTPLPRLGAAFTKAEREEGINARYFLAHAFLESGWGTSAIARYKKNLFGYSAFDRDPWKYAIRYKTYQAGIRSVAEKLRDGYLTPDGRWWYRFTTARAINRYYASDPRWADKVAYAANVIDRLIVTLRERGLRFGRPTLTAAPVAGDRLGIDVPWRAKPGAELPAAIRFAVRWTPVALLETTAEGPTEAPAAAWRLVRRVNRPGDVVRLAVKAPAQPGLWRLDVEARDSDGLSLPKTDRPAIRSLVVRVAAEQEAAVSVQLAADGSLEATVRNPGRVPIEAAGGGLTSTVEAWAFPLDPAVPAHLLASVPLERALEPGASRVVPFAAPATPAVVVVRLAGDPATLGRTLPVAALLTAGEGGRPALTALAVASPRDDALLGRTPAADRISLLPVEDPGALRVVMPGGTPWPEIRLELAAAERMSVRPALLVRSLTAEPDRAAAPTDALLDVPESSGEPPADTAVQPSAGAAAPSPSDAPAQPPTPSPGASSAAVSVDFAGLPPGIRLVMAALVPVGAEPVDPATIHLAWIVVAAAPTAEADPN
jgi:Mannosyl-glycoprotein endo-beta-N-acetylglucosaminidase